MIEAENTDRSTYYDIIESQYEAQITEQVNAEIPEVRAKIVEQLCAEVPPPCDSIADAVIEEALDQAMAVVYEEAMKEVRRQLELTHGEFWQERTCKRGEWIEVDTTDGYAWRQK